MKSHSLLLSQPLIPPTLRHEKNLTRRTLSCTNSLVDGRRISGKAWKALEFDFTRYDIGGDGYCCTWFIIWSGSEERYVDVAPVYEPGDTIWFKETYLKPPEITPKMLKDGADTWPKFDYMASCSEVEIEQYKEWGWKVKPSIHMPKAAARLRATCGTVTCERLQDITEEQARREGVDSIVFTEHGQLVRRYKNYSPGCLTYEPESAVESFKTLWASISGWDSYAANGPVYVIPFELILEPEMKDNTRGE